jgi:methionine sulfoxide reductase heme-binding subunit
MDRLNSALRQVPSWVVYLLAAVPFVLLAIAVATGNLGPDPVKTVERELGEWALRLMLATLCITPLRRAGLNLVRYRRALGLMTFFYVCLHLVTWVVLDLALRWGDIATEIVKRPYLLVGMIAFLLMVPLALTSSNRAIRRLGPAGWARLHRLTYLVTVLGLLHLVMLSKIWSGELLVYLAIGTALLGWRLAMRLRPSRLRSA